MSLFSQLLEYHIYFSESTIFLAIISCCLPYGALYIENQEFFERKRQLRGSSRTSATKRFDKTTGRGSQDLFSLEVIMSAHRKDIKQRKGIYYNKYIVSNQTIEKLRNSRSNQFDNFNTVQPSVSDHPQC